MTQREPVGTVTETPLSIVIGPALMALWPAVIVESVLMAAEFCT